MLPGRIRRESDVIFFTVGYQMPFERMLRIVDEWAGSREGVEIFAQIGQSTYKPQHLPFVEFMTPSEYEQRIREADLIVSHVGTGTIITALEHHTPLIVFPRQGALGETRNDHQVTYAERLRVIRGIRVTTSSEELVSALNGHHDASSTEEIASTADQSLLDRLRDFAGIS